MPEPKKKLTKEADELARAYERIPAEQQPVRSETAVYPAPKPGESWWGSVTPEEREEIAREGDRIRERERAQASKEADAATPPPPAPATVSVPSSGAMWRPSMDDAGRYGAPPTQTPPAAAPPAAPAPTTGQAAAATAADTLRYGPAGAVVAAARENPGVVREAVAPVTSLVRRAASVPGLVVGALRRRR